MVAFFQSGSQNVLLFSTFLEIFFFFACALAQKSLDPLSILFNVVEAGNARAAEMGKVFGGQALTPFIYPCICWWNEYVCKAGKGMASEGLDNLYRTIGHSEPLTQTQFIF
jgi:hypothetical protein